MSEFRLNDITIECSKCRHKMTFQNGDFGEPEVDAVDKRSMGLEFQHTWKLEEQECEKCHKHFSLSIDMWEYPVGCINYMEKKIDGASFVNEPEIAKLDDEEN